MGEQAAGITAEVLDIFGWSRPAVSNYSIMRNATTGPLAPGSAADIAYKLAVDPNNALAVDPTIVSAPPGDSLVLENIFRKWSYIGKA